MSAKNPEGLSVVAVAEGLGVTKQSVYNWLKNDGLLFVDTPKGKFIKLRDLIDWHVKLETAQPVKPVKNSASEPDEGEKESINDAILRKTVAEADIREHELAEMRRQVASIKDIEKVLTAANLATKTQVEALPARLSVQLVAIAEQKIIHGIIEREVKQLLTNLATIEDVIEKVDAEVGE